MNDQTNGNNHDEKRSRSFNPNERLVQIKTKDGFRDYLPVQWRLVWFREQCPDGVIETEMLHLDLDRETEEEAYVWNEEKKRSEKVIKRANGFAVFRAVVRDGKGGVGTGTKSEKAASFPDFIEKAETGSIGRALAALGYGTQFAPELDEEHRIVDSPVNRSNSSSSTSTGTPPAVATTARTSAVKNGNKVNENGYQVAVTENAPGASATEKQLASIRKLCQYLGRSEPADQTALSYIKAKELLDQLTLEYKQCRNAS
jgi:hypothetical protein